VVLINTFLNASACPSHFGLVYRTEVWSVGRPHVWCEVQSLVSEQLSSLADAWCTGNFASSLTDVWQQLFEQHDITVIYIIHFHSSLAA